MSNKDKDNQPSQAQLASQKSMRAVMRKNKSDWLALFAENACIEDPVGISPLDDTGKGHIGRNAIETFWDNNIAPNEFVFNIKESIAPEGSNECCNIGQIITRVNQYKSTSVTNGVFIYRVDPQSGLVVSLRAFYVFSEMAASTKPWPKSSSKL
jgi:steroid delta-isomerase